MGDRLDSIEQVEECRQLQLLHYCLVEVEIDESTRNVFVNEVSKNYLRKNYWNSKSRFSHHSNERIHLFSNFYHGKDVRMISRSKRIS